MEMNAELLTHALTLDYLVRTVDWARDNCRFWASAPPIRSMQDFVSLPVIERTTVRDHLKDLCPHGLEPTGYSSTSGTSTGQPLYIPRLASERASAAEYRVAIGLGAPANSEDGGLVFRLHSAGRAFRSLGTSSELGVTCLPNATNDLAWDNWDSIISQLFVRYPVGDRLDPVRILHSTPAFNLYLLTRIMLQRGVAPTEVGVRFLLGTGSHVPVAKRRWLEQAWGARFVTTFSCSEIPSWALECPLTPGRYHFDHTMFPEVLDPDTGASVDPGQQGRLVLTGIHPFQASCALLRYAVGDWARWIGFTRCECGRIAPTIDHLGRETRLLRVALPNGTALLTAIPVAEVAAEFSFVPDVPRPYFEYRAGNGVIQLDLETFHLRGPAWEAEAAAAVRSALLERDPELRRAVTAGVELRVRLLRRGELGGRVGLR